MRIAGQLFRFPHVMATFGAVAMFGLGSMELAWSIRFAHDGVSAKGTVSATYTKVVGYRDCLFRLKPHAILSHLVDYYFFDANDIRRIGTDGWNGTGPAYGNTISVDYLRSNPDVNRLHPPFGLDWIVSGIAFVLTVVLLTIPFRLGRNPSKVEEWQEYLREKHQEHHAHHHRLK